jgi:cell wall-associated NlpC family hydrolase
MIRTLKKAAQFVLCISMIVCGTAMRSAAQESASQETTQPLVIQPSGSASATTRTDTFDLRQLDSVDPKSFLLFMGTQIHETELDCSHFVQFLYEQAGLYYDYMPSRILYTGIKEFKRVSHPKAGDLVVWKGHVGIVVDPKQKTFLSSLRSGVKESSYESNYWKRRGRPRFLRYALQQKNASVWNGRKTIASGAFRSNSNSE